MDLKTARIKDVVRALANCDDPISLVGISQEIGCSIKHVRNVIETHGRLKQHHSSKYRKPIMDLIKSRLDMVSSHNGTP